MDQSAITVRYAKAYFSLAKDKNRLTELKKDVELVFTVCHESVDFILLLENPVIKQSKKEKIVSLIFSDKINRLTLDFLHLIIRKRRETHIPAICRYFLSLARKDQNIQSAVLTTAAEIDPAVIKKMVALIEKELKVKIELSTQIKPEIIGGMILRLDDKQYDASIALQLKKIRQNLLETGMK